MTEHVWKIPQPVKTLQEARAIITRNKKIFWGVAGAAAVAGFLYIRSKRDDTPEFQKVLHEMNVVEEQAVQQMSRLQFADKASAATVLKDSTLPIWKSFQQQVEATSNLNLDEPLGEKRQLLIDYAALRVKQAGLLEEAFNKNTNAHDAELQDVYNKINEILDLLQH